MPDKGAPADLIIPAEDQTRQAFASLRGYTYQVLASAMAWVELGDDGELLLELAEDYGELTRDALAMGQVKDTADSGTLTLRSDGAVAALNTLWRFREANPGRRVRLSYLTTSEPGREKGVSFPGDRPGVLHWRDAAGPGADASALRAFLQTLELEADLKAWLGSADDEAFKSELLRAVRWECGQPRIEVLEALLTERLVVLCDARGAPASSATTLRAHMVTDLLRAASSSDPAARRRSRAHLLQLVEQATSISLPVGAVRAAFGAGHSRGPARTQRLELLDALPPSGGTITRPAVEARLHDAVRRGRAWLSGASGVGKTSLARTVGRLSNRPWYVLDLRDADSAEVVRRIREGRRELAETPEPAGLVIDDLPLSALTAARGELERLQAQLERLDAALLLTAYRPPPPATRGDMALDDNSVLEAPYFTEAETAQAVKAGGGAPARWARLVHVFSGGGHPQLVAARIAGLRERGWPVAELSDGLATEGGPRDVEAQREVVRLQLLQQLPERALALLYRLSLLTGTFDRDLVLAVGAAQPSLPQPGAALDLLVGPWIEPRPDNAYRLSPLVQGSASKVLTRQETTEVHLAVAAQLSGRRPFPGDYLQQLLLSALACDHAEGARIVAWAALSPDTSGEHRRALLWLMPLLRTDASLFPADAEVNRMLRLAQLKVAAEGDDAAKIEAIYRRLVDETAGAPGGELTKTMAAFMVMTADRADIPPARWFDYLSDLQSPELVRIAEAEAEATDLSAFAQPDLGVFTLRASAVRGVDELRALFRALDDLSAERRFRFLDGLPHDYGGRRTIVELAWVRSAEKPDFDPRAAADTYSELRRTADRWGDVVLARECLCAQVVILAEYAGDRPAALALLGEAETVWPGHARLRRERAKILFSQGRFAEVAAGGAELLAATVGSGPVERTHLAREVALSAAEMGDYERAIPLLQQAEETAQESEALDPLRAGLAADRALIIWRAGRHQEALRDLRDALLAVEGLDLTTERGEYLVRGVSVVVRAMYQDVTSPGWDREFPSVLGVASQPPRAWGDGPVPTLLANWYQLASVERRLGIEAGVAPLLAARSLKRRIVTFELMNSTFAFLQALRSGDPNATVAGLSEFARIGGYIRAHPEAARPTDSLDPELFAEVEVMPWRGEFDADSPVQRTYVEAALITGATLASARGEPDWLARLPYAACPDPALGGFLETLIKHTPPDPQGTAFQSRRWAIEALRCDSLPAGELMLASVRLWALLNDTLLTGDLDGAVCPQIVRHWRRVANEARFSLRMPAVTAPKLVEAADTAVDHASLGRLILAALDATGIRADAELLAELQRCRSPQASLAPGLRAHLWPTPPRAAED